MKEQEIIYTEALKGMGFVPNSLHRMAAKPSILGSFSMLYANIKGFSNSETSIWTGLRIFLKNLKWTMQAIQASHQEVPAYLKDMIANVASNAAGCRYCQAHTAHTAHRNGVSVEKIQALWEYKSSPLFSEKEKAALDFAMAAGSVPNQVAETHHQQLRIYFTEAQIVEIAATVAVFGFLNRWNDSMATELEDEPFQFASDHLAANWDPGKHRQK
ncbi:MAG: carboxymuconolactone decarboxylase family protein [Bacteroidota bacterium]